MIPPQAPSNFTGTAVSHDRIVLFWNIALGASTYEVFRDGALAGNTTTTGFNDTSRSPSTTYTYTVRARNAAGFSENATTLSVTTPARPVIEDFDLVGNAPGGYRISSPGMKIHAALRGTKLYVATWFASPQNANDHFIFVGNQILGSATQNAAPAWNKAVKIALPANTPYLGQESSNGWCGWANAGANSRASASAQGNSLEGVIDLVETFGTLPETLYIAAAAIQTVGNGTLAAQAPDQTLNNGDIDPGELLVVPVASIRDTGGNGKLDRLDPQREFRPRLIQPVTGGLAFQIPTVPGIRYQLQYKAALADAWQDTGSPIPGLGTANQSINATVPAPGSPLDKGFFRIRVLE